MKIEKINDNSIQLLIESNELKARNLNLTDLSYGTEKAKELLLEIINIADSEVGFKADAPLSVEAVPLKEGNIKLIVSKVFDADELDARFSRFTPYNGNKSALSIMKLLESTFDKFEEALKIGNVKGVNEVKPIDKLEIRKEEEIVCIFEFDSIDKGTDACKNVNYYDYTSVFYKDEKNNKFYLVLSSVGNRPKEDIISFNKVCNALAEYGLRVQGGPKLNQAYYEEHYKVIIKEDAVRKLSML